MATPNIFKTGSQAKVNALINQALQLGATPAMLNTVTRGAISPNYTLPTAVSQNIPVGSEFDVDFNAPSSRYVPDQRSAREILSSSNSPFALIGRGVNAIANIPNMSLPALVPPYDPVAAKEQTQSLVNQNAIDTDILQDEYNLDKERRIADANISQYIPNIFKSRAPSYVVGGSLQDTRDIGIAKDRVAIQQEIDTGKKEIVKSLQAGGITAGEAEFNLDVLRQRQDRLNRAVQKTDENSAKFDKDREELLKSLGEDPTIKRGLSPSGTTDDTFKEKTPEEKSQDLQTAKIQTKLKDTSALDKSEGQGSGADNWFDAVNERVDLMAMGAAMLAGSSSGEGTLANLGKGLQAGIAAKKSAAQEAEAKKYRDAALALDAIRAQAAARKARVQERAAGLVDPFKNQTAKVNSIVAQLKAANIEGEPSDLNDLATLINTTDPSFVTAPQELRSSVLDYFAKEYGNNWFSDGGEIDITEARKGYLEALQSLSGTK